MTRLSWLKSKRINKARFTAVSVAVTAAPLIAAIVSDTATLTFPGAQVLIATANQIIQVYRSVKKNRAECREIAQRTRDLMMILLQATSGTHGKDLHAALVEDIERFEAELAKIKCSLTNMAARSTFQRVIFKDRDAETLREHIVSLQNAEKDFAIFSGINIRVFQSFAHRKNMKAHKESKQAHRQISRDLIEIRQSVTSIPLELRLSTLAVVLTFFFAHEAMVIRTF